jgi:hypothetical protein
MPKFHRRVVDRIAAQDQQQIHHAGIQILHQILSEAN